ncbi:MAG: C69 family dipeptidase [Pyramidobacter sp.]|nr:C69 family dipeptidase [Pyramidobacter sp.]
MNTRTLFRSAAALSAAVLMGSAAVACTPLGVGKNATVDGSILTAHTCDNWYDARVKVVPGGDHKEGEMVDINIVACMDSRPGRKLTLNGQVPQVPHTYTYFHIGYPFLNEHQVMIGEHTWTGRDEIQSANGMFYIENLEVLGLQRGKTAREVIKVMGELAEKYGYGDGGEGLIIADGKELWVFEICGAGLLWTRDSGKPGAIWAARRVPDDHFFVAANRSRLGVIDFEDKENFMYSSNITELAEQMGWWKKGTPFNFSHIFDCDNYGEAAKHSFGSSRREWRAFDLVAPSLKLTPGSGLQDYPFSVKPDTKLSVQDLQKIYRDHLEGTPYDLTKGLAAGPFGSPARYRPQKPKHDMEDRKAFASWERAIAVPQCSYSFIGQTRENMPAAIGGVLWFGLAAPDTTVYTPIYAGVTELPKNWGENDRVNFNFDNPWWAFNFVQQWAQHRWDMMYPEIQAEQKKIEQSYFDAQPALEKKAMELYAKDPAEAVKFLTKHCNDTMKNLENNWWAFAGHLVSKYGQLPYYIEDNKIKQPGYDKEWLKAVDFGSTMINDVKEGR